MARSSQAMTRCLEESFARAVGKSSDQLLFSAQVEGAP
jgi:hypothetical protein